MYDRGEEDEVVVVTVEKILEAEEEPRRSGKEVGVSVDVEAMEGKEVGQYDISKRLPAKYHSLTNIEAEEKHGWESAHQKSESASAPPKKTVLTLLHHNSADLLEMFCQVTIEHLCYFRSYECLVVHLPLFSQHESREQQATQHYLR